MRFPIRTVGHEILRVKTKIKIDHTVLFDENFISFHVFNVAVFDVSLTLTSKAIIIFAISEFEFLCWLG